MPNQIIFKKSSIAGKIPLVGDLEYGEFALNYNDGAIYYKTASNTIDVFVSGGAVQTSSVTTTSTTLDFAAAEHFHLTLQSNTTFTLSGLSSKIGRSGNIILIQDAVGGRTFTKAIEMKTPLGGATISQVTNANSISVISYYVVSSSIVLINYIGNFA